MPRTEKSTKYRPMNVVVRRGSKAEKHFRAMAALPGGASPEPDVLAPGLPPTPKHNLVFHGGRTMPALTFFNFYIGGAGSWDSGDRANIDKALAAAMSDRNLNNVMMQYFKNQQITSTFKGSTVLPGTKPDSFSQADIETLVKSLHAQGTLKGYDLTSTVFNFLLPRGSVLTTDSNGSSSVGASNASHRNPVHPEEDDSSLEGLGGYHGSVHVAPDTKIYYAIGVYSELLPDGRTNGIVAFDAPWKNIVATFYHELNEARTDADVEDAIRAGNDPGAVKFLGWVSRQGEECGDFPVSEATDLHLVMKEVGLTEGNGKVPIQFQYSNAVSGPEGPIPQPHPLKHA